MSESLDTKVGISGSGGTMRCYVCEQSDWQQVVVEHGGKTMPIQAESTIQVCKSCGNCAHDVSPAEEAKVKDFYRKEYRPQPNIMNLVTTTHKLNYVRVFLKDWLKECSGRQLKVGDVGAATGYMLNWFSQMGHKVSGSELTVTYRRMSEHYYGIPLAEELEAKHKYDLIIVYHVLEHLVEPDKKLAQYASLLADGGRMLIATPEWFNVLDEASGTPVRSFDHLFHKNHINVFSATSLQNLFRKCGLRVVKEDHVQYGQTYLLEKRLGAPLEREQWLTREDWREVIKTMVRHKVAIDLLVAGRHRDALDVEPRFPEAWIALIFGKFMKDVAKQQDTMEEATKHVGDNYRFILARGQWLYQNGRLAEAIQDFQRVLNLKPNEDTYMFMGYALAQSGRHKEAMEAFSVANAMDPRKWAEAQGWMLNIASNLPAWDEVALAEASKALNLKPQAQPQEAA